MIAVTVLCAASASDARAQDGSLILNEQALFGDIFSGQQLNVVDARQQVTVSHAAMGNRISGGSDGQDIAVENRQSSHGDVTARLDATFEREIAGRITTVTQARSNEGAIAANGAELALDSRQSAYGSTVAQTVYDNAEAHLTGGTQSSTAAYANNMSAGGQNAVLTGQVSQSSSGDTRAESFVAARYVPGTTTLSSDATANSVQLATTGSSAQRIGVTQSSEGWTASESVASAANAWASTTMASAAANRLNASNAGGSQVVSVDQTSTGGLSSRASTFAYDYGDLRAIADGTANQATIGNQDIWVEIDNSQFNSGGVVVEAELTGHIGYDAYVGANATGNSITGYACSDCGGIVNARSTQTNNGNVSATATATIGNQGRAVITGTTATGNSASFYVTKPGG